MQPVRYDLTLQAGDNAEIAFLLYSMDQAGALTPLVLAAGERFDLVVTWPGDSLSLSTADNSLKLTQTSGQPPEVRWSATPEQTSRLIRGEVVYAFIRTNATRGRRTYVTGGISVGRVPGNGPGDMTLNLSVRDGGITVQLNIAAG